MRRLAAVPTNDTSLPNSYAMWSPHRDSREVVLWKSMLAFRGEPWHWVDHLEQAHWYVVDVSRGVQPAWTEQLAKRHGVKGIALARHWIDLPAPCWTFFKVPLSPEQVLVWLEQEISRQRRLHAPLMLAALVPPTRPRWEASELRLTRWPDVTRYGDGSIGLTVACSVLLRDWTAYEDILPLVPDLPSLHAMLSDAQRRGFLLVADKKAHDPARPAASAPPVAAIEDGRWSLLKRIWKRFS